MKKILLLASFVLSTSIVSVVSAANSIPGRIDGDLYFHDKVHISSGVTYQEVLSDDGGSSSVTFGGEGSLSVGSRLGSGFPRVVLYGGTTLTVSQEFGDGVAQNWWVGDVVAPNTVLDIPRNLLSWENIANHKKVGGESSDGETKVAASFGFGAYTDTYSFSPTAYVVLPVDAPDNAKLWYAFHNVNTNECNSSSCNLGEEEEITIIENNFCIVADGLCVIEAEEMNQVSLIEESFEKCPREAVANGSIGTIPYCVITCNEGYHIDDNGVACVEDELLDEGGEEGEDPETPEDLPQQEETSAQQTNHPRRANQFHYTGAGLRLNLIDTTDLTGQELRNAQRRNLEINKRRGSNESNNKKDESSALSSLTKIVNDIRGKLWSWETGAKNDKLIVTTKENGELELNQGTSGEESGESESYGEETMHSAPLLPSTGSSTIFIIISILGIGLMLFAFNKR